ncbi:FxsA family protein [Anianabacter salinae]|uniref:FxsA family protein n=1 Tax=Anianabacter salinae TaxID=2851023 RepID=UPI00225E0E85|nr:FxsA family protein [Anianabacter salinae]MBV0913507.1 FxsA family protein [Anianabacter salinae]
MWLFLAFLLVPLIEIALFIQVGGLIGLWPTLGIVILTAVLGTVLVRAQGARALTQLRSSFSELRDPAEPLAHGAMILVSGALLLTPGFFTDAVGFLLLVPQFRAAAYRYLRARVKVKRFDMGGGSGPRPQPGRPSDPRGPIIEGEYSEVEPPKRPTHEGSGWTRH